MKTKNRKNLPEYFLNSAVATTYRPDPKRFSVTQVIGPPLIRTLLIKKWDELEQDVSDKLFALDGTATDEFLKKYSQLCLTNLKLELSIKDIFGIDGVLVGRPDFYHVIQHCIGDLKKTSAGNIKLKPDNSIGQRIRDSWTHQTNVYAYLMHKTLPELPVDSLEVHGWGRDWRRNEKLRYHNYPEIQIQVIPIPLWNIDETENYINMQLQDHVKHPYRECSREEKWQSNDKFAVMQMGRKSALRVLDSNKEAMDWCLEKKKAKKIDGKIILCNKIYIEKREGSCIRCEGYCSVSAVCPHKKGRR